MIEPSLLYELYNDIRQDKLLDKPGPEEYYLLFKLIDSGYPLKTFEDIAFAIETMWLKSQNQKQRFRELMEKRRTDIMEILKAMISEKASSETVEEPVKPTGKDEPVIGKKQPDEKTIIGPDDEIKTGKKTDTTTAVAEKTNGEGQIIPGNISGTKFTFVTNGEGGGTVLNIASKTTGPKALTEIPYLFTKDYFPVADRHLQQAWRSLKDKCMGGDTTEIDLEATIAMTSQQGYFSGVRFEKNIVNQLKLFIFIDRSNSMIAVEEFGRELCNTAVKSEQHKHLKPLYFTQVPEVNTAYSDYTVVSEDWLKSFRLKRLFRGLNKRSIVVMIYSDAGALKNSFDESLQRKIGSFLSFLNQHTSYVTWINPAPKNRWVGTNAELLSKRVPMFEAERSAMVSAMAALKGKYSITSQTESDASL